MLHLLFDSTEHKLIYKTYCTFIYLPYLCKVNVYHELIEENLMLLHFSKYNP